MLEPHLVYIGDVPVEYYVSENILHDKVRTSNVGTIVRI